MIKCSLPFENVYQTIAFKLFFFLNIHCFLLHFGTVAITF